MPEFWREFQWAKAFLSSSMVGWWVQVVQTKPELWWRSHRGFMDPGYPVPWLLGMLAM